MAIIRNTPTIGLPIQERGTPLWGTNLNSGLDTIDAAFLADRNRLTSLESTNAILPLAIVSKIGHNVLRNNTFERGLLTNPAQAVFWPSQFLNGASGFSTRDNTTAISGTWSNRISIVYVDTSPLAQTQPVYPGLNVLDPDNDTLLANTDQRQISNGFAYLYQTVNLLPHTTYTLSCYGKADIANISTNINIGWKIGVVFKDTMNAITHSYFSQPQMNNSTSNYSDSFLRTELTFNTPSNPIVTAEVWLVAEGTTPSSIGSVWVDGVQLEQATKATALDTFAMQGSNFFIDGNLTVGGSLSLQQEDLIFDSNKVTFLGNVQIGDDINNDTLEVFTKSSIFHGPLTVYGNVALGDDPLTDKVDVIANKTIFFNNQDTITPAGGDVEVQGNLDVKGNTILGSNSSTNTVTINAQLTVANTTLDVSGDVNILGGLSTQRAVSLGSNSPLDSFIVKMSDLGSTFEGDVYLKNNLKVDGDVTLGDALADNLYVKAGNAEFSGSVQIDNALLVYGPVNLDIGNSVSDTFSVNSNRTDIIATLASTLTTPQFDISGNVTIGSGQIAQFSNTNASLGSTSNELTSLNVYSTKASFSKDGYFGEDLQVVGNFNAQGNVFSLGSSGNVFSANAGTLTLGDVSAISSNLYSNTLQVYAGTTYFGDYSSQKKGHVNIGGDLLAAGNITLGSSISEDQINITGTQVNINVGTSLKVGGGFQNNTYNPLVADHGGLTIDNKGNLLLDGKLTVKGPFDPTSILISPYQLDGYNVKNVLTVSSPTLTPTTTFNLTSDGTMNISSSISIADGYIANVAQSGTSFGSTSQTLSSFKVYSPSSIFSGDVSASNLNIDGAIQTSSLETSNDLVVQGAATIQGNITSNGTEFSFGSAPSYNTSMQVKANNIELGLDGYNIGDVVVANNLSVRKDLNVGFLGQYYNNVSISAHKVSIDTASYFDGYYETAGFQIGGGYRNHVYNAFTQDHGGVTIDSYGNIYADGKITAKGPMGFDSIELDVALNGDPAGPVITIVDHSTGDAYTNLLVSGEGDMWTDGYVFAEDSNHSNLSIYSKNVGDGYYTVGDRNSSGNYHVSINPISDSIADLVTRGIGGTVFVKAGTYTLDNNLTIPSNVSIKGEEGSIIDGYSSYGIILSSNTKLENIKLQNCTTAVTIPLASSRANVTNITISSSTNGFSVAGSSNIVANCQVSVSGTEVSDTGSSNYLNVNGLMYSTLSFKTNTGIENISASSTLNIGTAGNTSTLNLGTGSNTNTINVGTGAGTTTINIGGSGDTVNISGTLTTVNTTDLNVADRNITLNKAGNDITSVGAGLTIDRAGTKGSLLYDSTLASRFKIGDLGSESEIISSNSTQTITGNKTFTGAVDIVGNGRGIVPLGSIIAMTSGLTGAMSIPATGVVSNGWMRADGAAIPGSNTVSGTTPNLSSSIFLRGATSYAGTGGANTFTLTTTHLPAHDHSATGLSVTGTNSPSASLSATATSIDLSHTHGTPALTLSGSSGDVSVSLDHTHNTNANTSFSSGVAAGANFTAPGAGGSSGTASNGAMNHTHTINHTHPANTTGGASITMNHSHPVTGTASAQIWTSGGITGNTATTGSGSSFDNQPNYIDVIYLIRVN